MKILYEDTQILVCEKPAGIPVQSKRIGTMDMVSMLKNYLKESGRGRGEPYLGLVHRLDQPVQGVLAFAKSKAAAASLSAQACDGRMEKEYRAVAVCKKDAQKQGHLTDFLIKDGRTNTSRVVKEGTAGAKKAELDYRILQVQDGKALVSINLLTGRHHQIRVQMAGAGMPLAGDRKYHTAPADGDAPIALCACRLTFLHPQTGKPMTFESRPEGIYFGQFLQN